MTRRNFIRLSLIAASCMFFPSQSFAKHSSKKTLVLVELNGGNDSLNTVVPYTSKNYYKLRENIAIPKWELSIINEHLGLHKNLKHISKLYKNNSLAIVNGLGYDNPNLSHFRSIQIVETASKSNEYLKKGWLSLELERFNLDE
ncbi:MAG: twin-arginine translocation pathway signal, partial [Campylobacteraceae bacterium]|nr:twin-arginine translocation pathway signal [Campylobacteraceae bacterium]